MLHSKPNWRSLLRKCSAPPRLSGSGGFLFSGWLGLGEGGFLGKASFIISSAWLGKGFLGGGGFLFSGWLGRSFLGGGGFLFSGWLGKGFLGGGGFLLAVGSAWANPC